GADYYLTMPFSGRELRQKARQLIARYRRIDEWITAPGADGPSQSPGRQASDAPDASESQGPDIEVRAGEVLDQHVPRQHPSPEATPDIGSLRGGQVRPGHDLDSDRATLLPYSEFVRHIEQMVEATIDGDSWFSVVGCRVNQNSDGHSTVHGAA